MSPLLSRLSRVAVFVLRFAIIGLAAAFIAVLLKPEWLGFRSVAPHGEPQVQPAAPPVRSYAQAVARSAPAVVNIYTARVITRRVEQPETFDFLPRYSRELENSLGSGVIIDASGHIVTNNHVVAEATSIMVKLADGRTAEASIAGRDPETDLAVLKIQLDKLPTMPLGRSDTLKVGDVVLAIGNPVGLSQTVTQGIISATGRGLGVTIFESFIQTDAAINMGNSGGALINTEGELIGINTAVFSRNVGIQGISFAIPVNLVRGVMDDILQKGRVMRGWLGVVPENLTDDLRQRLGLSPDIQGVVIANLYMDSPATRAGLRPMDVITHLNGKPMTTKAQALAFVAAIQPGQVLQLRCLRRKTPFELEVKVEERANGS